MGELPTRVQEQDPLLGPTPPTPTRPSRKPVLAAFAGALLVGLGYVVGFKDGKTGSTLSATDGWAFAPIADNRSGRDSSTLMATNEMIDHYGAEGQDYPWMDGLLVEPHYETTFVSSNTAKVWTVTSAETGEVVASSTATQFVHTFTAVGKFYITTDADDSGTVHVKYVRREIRSMTTAARLKLFEAWHVVIKEKDEKVAREKYGDDFTSLRKLAALHNNWAGAQECDHLHDGMGFITTHVAMNRIFELSLQSVDPSVSLPYWEYTVDVERVIDEENGNFQHWKDLEIWSDKYFGYTNPETGTIETGIFADIDMFADPLYSTVVNSYGLIRSPWNTLATDKVVRFQGSGGASTQKTEGVVCPDAVGLPTCSNLYDVLNTSKTILDFTRLSSMQAHGPIHLLTGGIGGQPDYINFFKNELGLSPVSAPSFPEAWNHVTEFFFVVARAAYRYGLLRVSRRLLRPAEPPHRCNSDRSSHSCLGSLLPSPHPAPRGAMTTPRFRTRRRAPTATRRTSSAWRRAMPARSWRLTCTRTCSSCTPIRTRSRTRS